MQTLPCTIVKRNHMNIFNKSIYSELNNKNLIYPQKIIDPSLLNNVAPTFCLLCWMHLPKTFLVPSALSSFSPLSSGPLPSNCYWWQSLICNVMFLMLSLRWSTSKPDDTSGPVFHCWDIQGRMYGSSALSAIKFSRDVLCGWEYSENPFVSSRQKEIVSTETCSTDESSPRNLMFHPWRKEIVLTWSRTMEKHRVGSNASFVRCFTWRFINGILL